MSSVHAIRPEVARRRILSHLSDLMSDRPRLQSLFEALNSTHSAWALVGGAPRTWALDLPDLPADLDVVTGEPAEALDATVDRWLNNHPTVEVATNRFGGYRLTVEDIIVDLWAARRTIGIRMGMTSDSNLFRAVAKSAALSIDSCVVTSRNTIYDAGFFQTLRTGVLCLNHSSPEAEEKVAEKALAMCREYHFLPDLKIQLLIGKVYGTGVVERLLSHLTRE